MSRIRSTDSTPERIVRSFLHVNGFRFRNNSAKLPGKPDIVLTKYKTVIFVHGCFWHRHKICRNNLTPKTNTKYWIKKFETNVNRDKKTVKLLKKLGWNVIIVWECDVNNKATLNKINQRLRSIIQIEELCQNL